MIKKQIVRDRCEKADGDMMFTVTESNARKIKALSMYARMLDDIAQECAEVPFVKEA